MNASTNNLSWISLESLDWGDGSPLVSNPSVPLSDAHTYTTPGTYTLQLVVVNQYDVNVKTTIEKTITVDALSIACGPL